MMGSKNELGLQPLIGALCLLAFALTFARLFYGVCLSDESIYVAYPYRFALGDRPFIDEWFRLQLAGIFSIPLVEIYLAVVGNSDGIVLFLRFAYFCATLAAAAVVYFSLPRSSPRIDRLLACSPLVVFMPWCIPNLGYNAIGSLSFVVGAFLGLRHLQTGELRWASVAGAAHAVTGFAMPNYTPALVLYLALLAVGAGARAGRTAIAYCLGGVLVVAALSPYWVALFSRESELLAEAAWHVGRSAPIGKAARDYLLSQEAYIPWILLGWLGATRLRRMGYSTAAAGIVLFTFVILPLLWEEQRTPSGSLFYVRNLAMWAPLFLLSLGPSLEGKRLLSNLWLPAFLAGLLTMWGSHTYQTAAGFGILPGLIVAVFGALRLAQTLSAQVGSDSYHQVARIGALAILLTLLGYQVSVYEDAGLSALTQRVPSGPFRGIRTTPQRRDLVVELCESLRLLATPGARVIFYEHFPAGYLLTSMRPAVPDMWDKQDSLRYIARALASPAKGPLYVVRLRYVLPYGEETANERSASPQTDAFVQKYGENVVARESFEIFRMRPLESVPSPRLGEVSSVARDF